MKIALVVPGGVDRTGTHRVIPCILWQIERLAAAGDEVHVFALQQEPKPGRWKLLGAEVHNAGARPRRLCAVAALLAEHRRSRFDVVHAYWAGPPGLVAAVFGRLTGTPMVVTLPGGDLAALPDIGYGAWRTRRGRFWTRLALSAAARIIVPSAWMRDQAATLGFKAIRIPLGVARDRWPVRAPQPRPAGAPLSLVHVANLNRVKDQDMLLRAMCSLRDRGVPFRLDVIGEDTLGGAMQRRAAALGLEADIAFHGFLPHAGMRRWIEAADLLVMSSRHEAGPIVTLEAALAGVPTVGTAVGHIADWAPEAAVAVPIGDSDALAEAIARLAQGEDERLCLARAAQALAITEDADFTAGELRKLYGGL